MKFVAAPRLSLDPQNWVTWREKRAIKRLRPLLLDEQRYVMAKHDDPTLPPELERYWMGRFTALDRLLKVIQKNDA